MITKRYLPSAKNLPDIMAKIVDGTAPPKFTLDHLKSIGFKSSNDRAVLPLLKDLGFLTDDGSPTERYHDYRNKSRSKAVMADALREAYQGIFHLHEKPTPSDRPAIEGMIKSENNVSDRFAQVSAATFLALLKLADLDSTGDATDTTPIDSGSQNHTDNQPVPEKPNATISPPPAVGLRYNVEVHLPASKDVEVYNAIFKSLKEHLLGH